jgi:hypothetical protein
MCQWSVLCRVLSTRRRHTHTHTHTQCGQFINFLYYVTSCLKRSLHAFQMKHISYYNYWVEFSVVVEVFFRDPMELTHRMVVTCSRRLYIIIIFLFVIWHQMFSVRKVIINLLFLDICIWFNLYNIFVWHYARFITHVFATFDQNVPKAQFISSASIPAPTELAEQRMYFLHSSGCSR